MGRQGSPENKGRGKPPLSMSSEKSQKKGFGVLCRLRSRRLWRPRPHSTRPSSRKLLQRGQRQSSAALVPGGQCSGRKHSSFASAQFTSSQHPLHRPYIFQLFSRILPMDTYVLAEVPAPPPPQFQNPHATPDDVKPGAIVRLGFLSFLG